MDDIIIRTTTKLPYTVKGLTALDSEGDYNVYINTNRGREDQAEALKHELDHIGRGHFYDDRLSVKDKETENGYPEEIKERQMEITSVYWEGP